MTSNPLLPLMLAALPLILSDCAGLDSGESAPAAASADALVPGTEFHATGTLRCRLGDGQAFGQWPFGVNRGGHGQATVVVTKPDGRKRTIFFEQGRALTADVSEADPGEFRATRDGDETTVRIGSETYQIPDAVIYGG